MRSQRKAYKAGSLAQDRIDWLINIGFKWALNVKCSEVPWETRFNELVQYEAKHGDCNVPKKQGTLGTWVRSQRAAYKAGSLAQDRIDRLSSIDFKWALKEADVPWETRFNELVQYKEKHGDCNVPQRQGQLGTWVDKQRFNCMKGKLYHRTASIASMTSALNGRCQEEVQERASKRSNRNRETESDDEVDEIGALIYDQAMRQRTAS